MAALTSAPKFYEHDENGAPLSGGKVYTYAAGTTTPLATYTTSTGGTPNTNPVILDSSGRANIWIDGSKLYKFIVKDSSDATIYTVDNIGNPSDGMYFIQSGTGAVARTAQSKMRDFVSVKDFGAVGNGSTDDTTALQNAINQAVAIGGDIYVPAELAGASFKTTAPLTADGAFGVVADGEAAVTILASGLSGGQYILDINCAAIDLVEHIDLSGFVLRSNNGLPSALRVKNASYVNVTNVTGYNVVDVVYLDGSRTFSSSFENLIGYSVSRNTVRFPSTFAGGGHHTFKNCTFAGDIGFCVLSGALLDSVCFLNPNFEQCITNSLFIGGTCRGLSFSGGRTEGCDGIDFVIRPYGASEYVGGMSISGMNFAASDGAGFSRILLGGDSGKVRGFSIIGNTVTHSLNAYAAKMVTLNGEGESGQIVGNYVCGHTADGAGVVNAQRAGVVVFSNENLDGKLAEYWGTADWGVEQGNWTPVDGSGAGLTFSAASGRYTKIGRMVFYQAFVQYPVTASGANAEIGGLPYTIGGLTGAAPGRAGGAVNDSNYGAEVGILQGITSSNELAIYNPFADTPITNASVSGKYFYISGMYSM